jgi:hypothetical protein
VVLVFLCLMYFTNMISTSIRVVTGFYKFHTFHVWIAFHGVYTPQFLYPFIYWQHLGRFHILAIVISVATNTRDQMSLPHIGFICFGYIPRSGIVGSYGSPIFNMLRNHHTMFSIRAILTRIHSVQDFSFLRVIGSNCYLSSFL